MPLDTLTPGIACVVDNDVDTTEGIDCCGYQMLSEALGGDAANAGHGLPAFCLDLRNHALRRVCIQIIDYHPCPLGGQFQGDTATNAAAGAGNDCGFSSKFLHRKTSSINQWPAAAPQATAGSLQLDVSAWVSQNGLRNSVLRTLPTPDSGSVSRNSTLRGHL
ncbi:hypothetical protein D3C80_1485710 [compost metagenome]